MTDAGRSELPRAHIVLGSMIREARVAAGIMHIQLQESTRISQSRLSKIETGKYGLPDWRDIERILEGIGVASSVRSLIRRQHDIALLDPTTYVAMGLSGLDVKQAQMAAIERESRLIRAYQTSVFPGVLQTPEYAMAVFTCLGHSFESATRATEVRLARQNLLHNRARQFVFVVNEAVLYSCPLAGPDADAVLLYQLDFVASSCQLSNVDFRVLQTQNGLPVSAANPFIIMDRRYVSAEATTRELVSTSAVEVREYEKAFEDVLHRSSSSDVSLERLHAARAHLQNRGVKKVRVATEGYFSGSST